MIYVAAAVVGIALCWGAFAFDRYELRREARKRIEAFRQMQGPRCR